MLYSGFGPEHRGGPLHKRSSVISLGNDPRLQAANTRDALARIATIQPLIKTQRPADADPAVVDRAMGEAD